MRHSSRRRAGNPLGFILGIAAVVSAQQRGDPGQTLFAEHCAVCHGALGDGGSAPDLTNRPWQAGITDEQLERIIRQGVRGSAMPAFGETLSADSRRTLVRHIRSLAAGGADSSAAANVPTIAVGVDRLLAAERDESNWLMYGHDYSNHAFSPLAQINRDNVKNLVAVWSFQTGTPDGLMATPLFVDGVIFL